MPKVDLLEPPKQELKGGGEGGWGNVGVEAAPPSLAQQPEGGGVGWVGFFPNDPYVLCETAYGP